MFIHTAWEECDYRLRVLESILQHRGSANMDAQVCDRVRGKGELKIKSMTTGRLVISRDEKI